LLFLALFIFFSLLLVWRRKKGFSSFACALVGDYMRVCVREQAKKRVLAGIVENETYRERKRLQV
jgi:hypothetical protein